MQHYTDRWHCSHLADCISCAEWYQVRNLQLLQGLGDPRWIKLFAKNKLYANVRFVQGVALSAEGSMMHLSLHTNAPQVRDPLSADLCATCVHDWPCCTLRNFHWKVRADQLQQRAVLQRGQKDWSRTEKRSFSQRMTLHTSNELHTGLPGNKRQYRYLSVSV